MDGTTPTIWRMSKRLATGAWADARGGRAEVSCRGNVSHGGGVLHGGVASRRHAVRRLALAACLLAASCCALVVVGASASAAARSQEASDGFMRVELPAGREVRVENRRGGVSVELWDEPQVGIAAEVEGGGDAGGRSPVRLDRTTGSLAVVVAGVSPRAKSAPRVDLRLRVPRDARLSVFTADGALEVAGAPARLDAQTISGALRVRLANDADVMARTLSGTITVGAGLVAPASVERTARERFHARLGAGTRLVRLSTARGHIELAPLGDEASARRTTAQLPAPRAAQSRPEVEPQPPAESRRPVLRDAESGQAAQPAARRPPVIVGAKDSQLGRTAPTPAPTPAEGPIEVDPDEIITVDTHVVTLNLSVVDRQSGRGLTGLGRDDFRVSEDGVEQQITHFETANAPFDLLLLLDLSGSTAKVTEVIRASALRFVESVRAGDRVGVVAFAAAPQVVSNLTADRAALRSRVAGMGAPAGDTKLYDAVAFAVEYLEKNSPKERRRAVILMSDGLDSVLPNVQGDGSVLSYEEARSRVQEFDGLFYAVWTDNSYDALSPLDVQPETFDLVYDRMEELSKVGGGLFYEVEKLEDLAGAYERVVQDLGTVYSLSYLPADKRRDGRWRAVRVRLPRRPEAVARGKSGYFAK